MGEEDREEEWERRSGEKLLQPKRRVSNAPEKISWEEIVHRPENNYFLENRIT